MEYDWEMDAAVHVQSKLYSIVHASWHLVSC